MKTKPITLLVVGLWCVGLPLAPHVNAEDIAVRSVDIALQGEGLLIGQVVDTQGKGLAGASVVLKASSK